MNIFQKLFWNQVFPFLRVSGTGAREFLHGQTTAELLGVNEGVIVAGCWLSATGRLRALLEMRVDLEGVDVVVLAGDVDDLVKGFDQVIFPADKVRLEPLKEIRRVQILENQVFSNANTIKWLRDDDSLPDCFASLKPASPDEFEIWRLKTGLPIGSGEINGETNPFELGLSNLVDLKKGCYLGQETMAKLAVAGKLKQQLRYWEADGFIEEGTILQTSLSTSVENRNAGVVTSALNNQGLGRSIGLAIVRRHALSEEELFISDDSKKVRLSVPDSFVPPSFGN